MIHIGCGSNKIRTKNLFDRPISYYVNHDVVGQSHYSWWHRSLSELGENMIFVPEEFRKDTFVAKVAYHWMPAKYQKRPAQLPVTLERQVQSPEEVSNFSGNETLQQAESSYGFSSCSSLNPR